MDKLDKYIFKSVINYLDGDMELFNNYKNKAIEIYEEEKNIITIEELLPRKVKHQLYEMVS